MAFRNLGESPKEASPGQLLLVVRKCNTIQSIDSNNLLKWPATRISTDDFEARSADELSLAKGDKIELIERDDDFGDGWYLGKHLQNGRTGLFPEVYTMTALRQTYSHLAKSIQNTDSHTQEFPIISSASPKFSNGDRHSIASTVSQETLNRQPSYHEISDQYKNSTRATPPPLYSSSGSPRTASLPAAAFSTQISTVPIAAQRSISMMMGGNRNHGEDSPVMNETLSVIDEHITDLNTPRSSLLAPDLRATNDSGSEYSSHIDHRLSYINGNETDEEERAAHNEAEVLEWTPLQVAQCLRELGVESRHCEVFKEQEITGEVLMSMDQASVFMKEFDLGLVGRRLRTWHKIKAFQEEVKAYKQPRSRAVNLFGGSGTSSDDFDRTLSQSSTSGSMLPRMLSLNDHNNSRVDTRQPRQENPPISSSPRLSNDVHGTPPTASSFRPFDSPRHSPRPSAASIRDFNHSRRHSSADFSPKSASSKFLDVEQPRSPNRTPSPHKKHPSFDRNWTMGGAIGDSTSQTTSALAITALGMSSHGLPLSTDRNSFHPNIQDLGLERPIPGDVDHGYLSSSEIDGKKSRNVLRKRDVVSASHSRQSSYREESSSKLSVPKRHSRFASADSIRDTLASVTSPASKIYHANSIKGRFRSSSVKENVSAKALDTGSAKGVVSPVVTKLDYGDSPESSVNVPSPRPDTESPSIKQGPFTRMGNLNHASDKPQVGVRTTSDAVTKSEKTLVASPSSINSAIKESPIQSPTRTGSTTTSGASKSFELESTDASSKDTSSTPIVIVPVGGTKRGRDKKKTSAYTRGLEKRSPQEQMLDCDYSGWMKKKSPSLMTTWKPRLFVLRGRRLSYYYSENDTEEKGLIDISSHRVLSANNDRLTGLHATVTGAKSSPTSPANSHTPTLNDAEVAAQTDTGSQKPATDGIFIFKLVPPRAGLSRAVNFTKPTIHYFAVDNVQQGRLWMAALMKATIERDDVNPIKTTYNQKTISLAKAKAMRQRPPGLMGGDESLATKDRTQADASTTPSDETGLNIQGLDLSYEYIPPEVEKNTAEGGMPGSSPPFSAPLADEAPHETEKVGSPHDLERAPSSGGTQRSVGSGPEPQQGAADGDNGDHTTTPPTTAGSSVDDSIPGPAGSETGDAPVAEGH
ncbi:polar growth protein [Xylographa opegraphella]|nr:polar growth protein [Xylographa opegraphella]